MVCFGFPFGPLFDASLLCMTMRCPTLPCANNGVMGFCARTLLCAALPTLRPSPPYRGWGGVGVPHLAASGWPASARFE